MNKLIIFLNLVALVVVLVMGWLLDGELITGREAKLKLAEFEAQASHQAGDKNLLSEFDGVGAQVDSYFASNETLTNLIESLETEASVSGVALELTQATVEEQAPSSKLSLALSATGTFAHVTNYLARLEAMPYELAFSNVRLSEELVDGKSVVWRLQTSLELLSYRNEKN